MCRNIAEKESNMKLASKLLVLAAAAAFAGPALSQAPQGPGDGPGRMGPGTGPGMMGGYGPGGRGGYGPGYGAGPGMMGGYGPGYGMGPGMMGGYGPGYGMGPGMMGGYGPGYGMGPGMMGGYGPGYGMGPLHMIDLDDAQRGKVNQVGDALRKKNWQILGQMQDERAKLRDLYLADKDDRSAILAAYKRLFDLRLQRVEAMLDARAELEAVLTKEQREQLRRFRPGWMMGDLR